MFSMFSSGRGTVRPARLTLVSASVDSLNLTKFVVDVAECFNLLIIYLLIFPELPGYNAFGSACAMVLGSAGTASCVMHYLGRDHEVMSQQRGGEEQLG